MIILRGGLTFIAVPDIASFTKLHLIFCNGKGVILPHGTLQLPKNGSTVDSFRRNRFDKTGLHCRIFTFTRVFYSFVALYT